MTDNILYQMVLLIPTLAIFGALCYLSGSSATVNPAVKRRMNANGRMPSAMHRMSGKSVLGGGSPRLVHQ